MKDIARAQSLSLEIATKTEMTFFAHFYCISLSKKLGRIKICLKKSFRMFVIQINLSFELSATRALAPLTFSSLK